MQPTPSHPQSANFHFSLEKTTTIGDNYCRAGTMLMPHGEVPTPIFMPVGTQATVKAVDSRDLHEAHTPIILANTYHLYLRPGMETLQKAGGVHQFMQWDKPILTDSGGFQVFSLGKQKEMKNEQSSTRITAEGVEFTSHLDGSRHFFSPEKAIEVQRQIGADIIMAFDECTPDDASPEYAQEALDRTHRWAAQCVEYWETHQRQSLYGKYQALFGIIQGGQHHALRQQSAEAITSLPFDGIAIGGETIGYNMPMTVEILRALRARLPSHKPIYLMGLGRDPQNILDAVQAGADMFDCVAPTRLARNGALYHGELGLQDGVFTFQSAFDKGRLNIGNAAFAQDNVIIQANCDCMTCRFGYSRAYLHHLFRTKELEYYRLASIHNLRFMVRLTQQLRTEIIRG
jgi:queuine tRNA-ribosyltransferase